MQSMLNIHGSYGLPISVSGITHHFIISEEMADHELRREAMKRQRSLTSKVGMYQLEDLERNPARGGQEDMEGKTDGDLACNCFIFIAKAA